MEYLDNFVQWITWISSEIKIFCHDSPYHCIMKHFEGKEKAWFDSTTSHLLRSWTYIYIYVQGMAPADLCFLPLKELRFWRLVRLSKFHPYDGLQNSFSMPCPPHSAAHSNFNSILLVAWPKSSSLMSLKPISLRLMLLQFFQGYIWS